MSEYDELVKILRDGGWRGAEAADAIEALVGDVETAKSQFKALQMVTSKEHEDTRAERDRLKAALQDCIDAYDFVIVDEYDRGWSSVSDAIHAARKALGGDA